MTTHYPKPFAPTFGKDDVGTTWAWGWGVGGTGAGGWGWVLLGWTGLVLLCTAQNPARLVYGSAALVASLRGQHCHFATLPITHY